MAHRQVSFSWINKGLPFTLRDPPIVGCRELNGIKKKRNAVLAALAKSAFIARGGAALATRNILKKSGIKAAKEAWDATLPSIFWGFDHSILIWSEDDFVDSFNEWCDTEVLHRLGVTDDAEAEQKLREMAKTIDSGTFTDALEDYDIQHFVSELYWRLKGQFSEVEVAGESLPLTPESLELAAVYPEDAITLRRALREVAELA